MNENAYSDIQTAVMIVVPGEHEAICSLVPDDPSDRERTRTTSGAPVDIVKVQKNNGGSHRIVIAGLHKPGTNHAARMVTELKYTFQSIRYVILCGIAGGVPRDNSNNYSNGVRPGDVIVADKGVLQYDYGEESFDVEKKEEMFAIQANPIECSSNLQSIVQQIRGRGSHKWYAWLEEKLEQEEYLRLKPPNKAPRFEREKIHPSGNHEYVVKDVNCGQKPKIARGALGSANRILKNPKRRDELYLKSDVIGIDMESAGVADASFALGIGFLVVKGVSDFCDGQKTAGWQRYAAAVAAAFARAVIAEIPDSPQEALPIAVTPSGPGGGYQLHAQTEPPELVQNIAEIERSRSRSAGGLEESSVGTQKLEKYSDTFSDQAWQSILGIRNAANELRRLEARHEWGRLIEISHRLWDEINFDELKLDNNSKKEILTLIARAFIFESDRQIPNKKSALIELAKNVLEHARSFQNE